MAQYNRDCCDQPLPQWMREWHREVGRPFAASDLGRQSRGPVEIGRWLVENAGLLWRVSTIAVFADEV